MRVIKQEIRSATEKQYLAQLEESTRTGAFDIPLTSPIFEPPPEDLPRPVQASLTKILIEPQEMTNLRNELITAGFQ